MKPFRFRRLVLVIAMAAGAPAIAGPGHDHGPKHGGVVREVKGVSYELVAKPDALLVHVSDHGKPLSTEGAKARATVYAGNDKSEVALEPAANGTLAGRGSFKTGVGTRVAVAVELKGKPEQTVTFNLK